MNIYEFAKWDIELATNSDGRGLFIRRKSDGTWQQIVGNCTLIGTTRKQVYDYYYRHGGKDIIQRQKRMS